jgi:hypothetical protein
MAADFCSALRIGCGDRHGCSKNHSVIRRLVLTYRDLLDFLSGLTEVGLDKAAYVRIADQVIPVAGIYDCGCGACPMLDLGPIEGVPAGRA